MVGRSVLGDLYAEMNVDEKNSKTSACIVGINAYQPKEN